MSKIDNPYMTVILIDEETGKPLDENDPLYLSKDQYDFVSDLAEANGNSFEEELSSVIRIGLESLIAQNSTQGSRITFSETKGSRRAYSYDVSYVLPRGTFSEEDLPDDLVGELESISQSDDAPAFLWSLDGALEIRVTEAHP